MNPHTSFRFILTRALSIALFLCMVAFATAAAAGQTPAAPDPIEGKWSGVTGFPTDRVEISFEFKRNEKGELKGYLYQTLMNFYGLELPGTVNKVGDKYVHEDWVITLTLREGKLEGPYMPLGAPISLQRTDTLPKEVPLPALPAGPAPK